MNVHRVIITSILLAAKFFDDAYYNNAYYAKVGGVLVNELNGLEVDFLFRINFSLHVPPDTFEKYKAELVAHSINIGIVTDHSHRYPPIDASYEEQIPPQSHESIKYVDSGSLTSVERNSDSPMNETTSSTQQQQEEEHSQGNFVSNSQNRNSDILQQTFPLVPKQVTPSPSLSSDDVAGFGNGVNPNSCTDLHSNYQQNELEALRSQPRATNETTILENPFEELASSEPAHATASSHSKYRDVSHMNTPSILMQRASSLPVSSGRCIDHAFRMSMPNSAPPMPVSIPNVLAAVSSEDRYMINQLFPIENKLIHHNHNGDAASSVAGYINYQQGSRHDIATGLIACEHPGMIVPSHTLTIEATGVSPTI